MIEMKDIKERFEAVEDIFSGSSTTIERLRSVKTLLEGVHPKLDLHLEKYEHHLTVLEQLEGGDHVELLATETLPENTEEEKKRKKALLLFLRSWKDLQGEMERVEKEMQDAQASGGSTGTMWGNILRKAKGPLFLVTAIAVGVALLKTTSVDILIQNDGCSPLEAKSSIPVNIPGLSLPNTSIVSGSSATATIPPLTLTVDGSSRGSLKLTVLTFSMSFDLSGADDIIFDGTSLVGAQTSIALSAKKEHMLVIRCR